MTGEQRTANTVLFLQAGEVQVGEDVAEKNQAAITVLRENAPGLARPDHGRAQVQVRQDQRVIDVGIHDFIVSLECYDAMNRRTASGGE